MERLGSGATGVVYRAEDRQKTQLYLVKVMISNPSDLRRRWNDVLDYLGAYCQCEHRALAALVDVQVQQGFFTLVSYPYLGSDGRPVNLLQASRIYGNHQGLLNQFDVRGIALILLEALQKLHLRNILHMNIKPSNVLFPASANQALPQWYAGLKLTDAGTPYFIGMQYYGKLIKKALPYYCAPNRMKPDIRSLIQSYDFMAPELKRGEEARPESDLYSLAMLILWALTGIPHLCIQARPSRMRSGVDPAWDPIFFKALQENPARRYQSADEMAADIAALPF
ncbi:MAG: hypothetical protein D6820_12345 [Lentisphaerae bacterium]|nr:MAG: hypothetical protein D6820_12345 [Lentisphaerota bacterium]